MRALFLQLAVCSCALGQTADSSLTFEAASVKVTGAAYATSVRKSSSGVSAQQGADPTLFARNPATLQSLLMTAYSLRPQQVIGPSWLTTEHFDIMARVPEGATSQQQLFMLRNLLAERFLVKLHREQREMPVYEMVIAKGGSKLNRPGTDKVPELKPDGAFQLGMRDGANQIRLWGRGSLEVMAARLCHLSDRLIIDRTGLTGIYDIDLRWWVGEPPASASPSAGDPAIDFGIDLAAGMEADLGLTLQAKKAPIEVLIVDHAEKVPTNN